MKKYIAFLRAINVGGTKIIKMEDLKRMFESFGLASVQTYIATGNVIFETKDSAKLEAKLESQIEKALGYKVEIFLRTMEEAMEIAHNPPFTPQDNQTLHVVLLRRNQPVEKKLEQELLSLRSEEDDFAVKGSEVYNLRYDRDRSIFSNSFIEKILKTSATTRNWNTLCKIAEKYK